MDKTAQIDHFLITRFNLKNNHWTEQNVLDPVWLHKRIKIFEQFCYPSVLNQTQQNFKWLLFFDADTPLEIKNYVSQKYTRQNIHVYYINGFKELENSCISIIKSLLKTSFFITSRLDNDDALHKNYIKTVQSLAILKNKTIIDVTKGCQLYLRGSKGIVNLFVSKYNPFISLVSSIDNMELIIEKEHNDWNCKTYKYIFYNKQPLWLQYIHDTNYLNIFNTALKKISIDINDFNVKNISIDTVTIQDKILNSINLPKRMYLTLLSQLRLKIKQMKRSLH